MEVSLVLFLLSAIFSSSHAFPLWHCNKQNFGAALFHRCPTSCVFAKLKDGFSASDCFHYPCDTSFDSFLNQSIKWWSSCGIHVSSAFHNNLDVFIMFAAFVCVCIRALCWSDALLITGFLGRSSLNISPLSSAAFHWSQVHTAPTDRITAISHVSQWLLLLVTSCGSSNLEVLVSI